jgi:2-polyprenyl-6-hydroxyphenyl methylase/3-demethylubiquinone-9 3-methyltransferase
VRIRGPDRYLPALPGAGLNADRLQRDRQQSRRHLLAGRDHGVIFAGVVHRRGVAAPFHEFVGLAGHRRHDNGDIVSGIDFAFDVTRDVADAVDICDGCTAEFHHEAAHDDACIPCEDK